MAANNIRVAVYSFSQVTLKIAGIIITDGAEDDFVTIEEMGEGFTDEVSQTGLVVRSEDHDPRQKVNVKLKGASKDNKRLHALYKAAKARTDGATGIGSFLLEDKSGTMLMTAVSSWIVKRPTKTVGKTQGPTDWEFRVVTPESNLELGDN